MEHASSLSVPLLADMHTGKKIIPLSGGFDGHFAVVEKEIDEADTGKKVRSWTWIKQETKEGK